MCWQFSVFCRQPPPPSPIAKLSFGNFIQPALEQAVVEYETNVIVAKI